MRTSLTPKQHEAIHALATGADVTAAAAAGGVHRTTIHNWVRTNPVFRAALREGKAAHVENLQDDLRRLSNSAISVLRGVLENDQASESNRLRAALAIIRAVEGQHPDHRTAASRSFETFMDASAQAGGENAMLNVALEAKPAAATPANTPRNAPCPCGSGNKYKRCCGVNAPPALSAVA